MIAVTRMSCWIDCRSVETRFVSLADDTVAALVEALSSSRPRDPVLGPDLRKCLGALELNYRKWCYFAIIMA